MMQNNWILESRKKLQLTQREFAELIGVSVVTVSRWENGFRTPRIKNLIYVADLLGISPGELLDCKLDKEEP